MIHYNVISDAISNKKKGGRSDPFKILIYKFLLLWNELNYIFFFFFSYGKCAFRIWGYVKQEIYFSVLFGMWNQQPFRR